MKTIMSLVLILSTSYLSRAQITASSSSWTTAYCNEEYGLNYKTAAVPLNQRVSPLAGTGSVQAANLPISGVPSNVQIRKVFLWFSIVGQTTAVTNFPSLTVKDPLGGTLPITNLTCVSTINNAATSWQGSAGTNFASGYTHNYRAEVTLTGATYNGNYTINGLPTITTTNPDVDATGATLMIIYKDMTDCTKGSLFIQDIYMLNGLCLAGSFSSLNMCFSLPPINTPFTQFVNGVDYEITNGVYSLELSGVTTTPFTGDMWNFVSQSAPFNDGGSTAPTDWIICSSSDNVAGPNRAFSSVRGFFWRGGTISTPITSSFNVNSVNCSGVISVNGSGSTGPIANHFWEIVESNSSGVPVAGGYIYSTWLSGMPGSFTFPSAPCGKYYRIKLATQNGCEPWVETAQIRYVPCPPSLKLAKTPSEICSGESVGLSVTITGASPSNCNMVWTPISPAGPAIYNGAPASIMVTPTVTTTYQCTVTDVTTGCIATIQKTITVHNNNPNFTFQNYNTSNSGYFTVEAKPVDQTALSQPGFGYVWNVERLNSSNAQVFIVPNSPCWWTFNPPTVTMNSFNGLDNVANNYSGTVTLANCSNPTAGKFLYNTTYLVTRGTWNDVCPWNQQVQTLRVNIALPITGGPEHEVLSYEVSDASDASYLMKAGMVETGAPTELFSVSPNPGTGLFTIELGSDLKAAIEVFDIHGSKIATFEHSGIRSTLDLTDYPKGIYLISVNIDGTISAQKIIVE